MVRTINIEGNRGDRTTTKKEHLNIEVNSSEHYTNSNRTTEPIEICLRGLYLVDTSLSISSSKEEVITSSFLTLYYLTSTTSFVKTAIDNSRDSLERLDLTSKPSSSILSEEELRFY